MNKDIFIFSILNRMNLIDSIFPSHQGKESFRPKNNWQEQDDNDYGKDDISIRRRKEYPHQINDDFMESQYNLAFKSS